MSLWDNPVFKAAYDSLSVADKDKYKKIGEQMYNCDIDYYDPKVIEYNYAKKIDLMLRDGLAVDDMTTEQKMMYMEAFGVEALEKYMEPEKRSKKSIRTKTKRKARVVGGKRI